MQSSTYEMKMKPYVEYWKDILLHLSRPFPPQSTIFLEGFWPSSNWRSDYARVSLSTVMDGSKHNKRAHSKCNHYLIFSHFKLLHQMNVKKVWCICTKMILI